MSLRKKDNVDDFLNNEMFKITKVISLVVQCTT